MDDLSQYEEVEFLRNNLTGNWIKLDEITLEKVIQI